MSTSLIKCKQEISAPSSVVSQRKEDFPEETVSSLLDRLFPKTSTSGILWQLKTGFQTGVRITPGCSPQNRDLVKNPPAWKSVYKCLWNGFSAHCPSSWGAAANNSPSPACACAGGRESKGSVCIPPPQASWDNSWQYLTSAVTGTPQHIDWLLGDFATGGRAPRLRVCVPGWVHLVSPWQWAAPAWALGLSQKILPRKCSMLQICYVCLYGEKKKRGRRG